MAEASTNYSVDELNEMMDTGQITGAEYDQIFASQELATKSPLDVAPEVLDYAYDNNMMPEQEYAAAREYHDSPTKFYAKDLAKGAAVGVAKFAKSTEGFIGEIYNWFNPEERYESSEIEDKAMSKPGQFTTVGAQIASGWIATGGVGALSKVGVEATVGKLGLAKTMPKLTKYLTSVLPNMVRGAATDIIAFDPYEGRMADMIHEFGLDESNSLAKAYVHYLSTDKTNDPTEERLKTAVEGLGMGFAIDGLGHLIMPIFKLAKARMLAKHEGSIAKVRSELMEHPKAGPILEEAKKDIDDEFEQLLVAHEEEAIAKRSEELTTITPQDFSKEWKEKGVDNLVREKGDFLELITVRAKNPGQGQGTEFMQELTRMADSQGKEVRLTASSLGTGFTDEAKKATGHKLARFYSRFGFKVEKAAEGHGWDMYRPPRKTNAGANQALTEAEAKSKIHVKNTVDQQIKDRNIFDAVTEEAKPDEMLRGRFTNQDRLIDMADGTSTVKFVEGLEAGKTVIGAIKENMEKLIDDARGGPLKIRSTKNGKTVTYRVSDATTSRRADSYLKSLGAMTGEDPARVNSAFKKVHNDVKHIPEVLLGIKEYFTNYANEVGLMCKRVASEGATDNDMVKTLMHLQTLEEMQAELLGIGSHIGRAMHQLGRKTGLKKFDFGSLAETQWKKLVKDNPEKMKDLILKASKMEDPETLMRLSRVLNRSGWQEATEFAQMNALSGWRTHVRNVESQAIMLGSEATMRSIVGIGRAAAGNFDELKAVGKLWSGMGHGFVNALKPGSWQNVLKIPAYTITTTFLERPEIIEKVLADPKMGSAWKALISGIPQLDKVTKVAFQGGAKVSLKPGRKVFEALKRPIRRLSFDLLTGADEAFKQMTHEGFLRSEAVDACIEKGFQGKALSARVDQLIADPPQELIDSAMQKARNMTFQEDLPVDNITKKLNHALNGRGPAAMMARLGGFLFFKTPVNILRATQRMTPLAAMFQKRVRANLAAGGIRAQMEVARQTSGAALMGGVYGLWTAGNLTGKFPEDLRTEMQQAGYQEYSIRIGNEWWSYKHIEPFATLMGATANLLEAAKHIGEDEELELMSGEAFLSLATAITDPIVQNSYLKGFLELTKVFDPRSEKAATAKFEGMAELFIPALGFLNNIGDTSADDWSRETKTWSDRIERKLNLIMKDERAIRRNTVTGEKLKRTDPWLAAGQRSTMSDSPVDKEIASLGITVRGWKEDLKVQGITMELDKDQLNKLWDIYEATDVKDELLQTVKDPDFQSQNSTIKEKWLRKIINGYRKLAVYTFLDEQEGDFTVAKDFNQKQEEWAEILGGEKPFRQYKMKVQDKIKLKEFIE